MRTHRQTRPTTPEHAPASRAGASRNTLRLACALAAALALGLAPAGCAARSSPTPLPYRAGAPLDLSSPPTQRANGVTDRVADRVAGRVADQTDTRPAEVSVLYATNRRPKGNNGYSAKRGITTRLGIAEVRFGNPNQTAGDVARQLAKNKRPKVTVTALREFGEHWRSIPLSDPRFLELPGAPGGERREIDDHHPLAQPETLFIQELNRRVAGGRRILLYVPGFNTSFEAPLHLGAELGLYLRGESVPVVFSWPARSSPLGYSKQLTTADASVRALRNFIELLIEQTDAEAIDVLSYSAGAPMVSDALMQLRLKHNDLRGTDLHERLRIGSIIYAGADEDIDRFRAMYLDGFADVAERITLYSSRRDAGLVLSEFLVRGSKRLGRLSENLTPSERVLLSSLGNNTDIIDVSQAQGRAGGGDIFSHAYWYGNPWVSTDLIASIRSDRTPGQRGLQRRPAPNNADEPQDPVWRFPRDYPQRVRAMFSQQRSNAE